MRWQAMIFILLAGSGVAYAETFVSRTHGVSFEIPAGMSVAGGNFGGRVARLDKKDAGSISVRRVDGQRGKIEKIAKGRFARLPSDVSLGSFFDSTIGGKKVSSAAFEFPSQKIKGTVFYTAAPHGLVELFCAAEESKYLEIFFDCAGLIENLKFFKGTSKNLLQSEILIPSSETRKMSKKTGGVANGYVDGFFVKSDEVVAEGAKLQPKEVFGGALKAQDKNPHREAGDCAPIAGPEENPDAIELEIFENGLDLSGACGAMAWHRAALGVSRLNLDEAKKWLLFAIESDRSYIPAYILLARLKLAGGEDAGSVVNEVNKLLDRAPQNEEILKLKEKLAGIAYKDEPKEFFR